VRNAKAGEDADNEIKHAMNALGAKILMSEHFKFLRTRSFNHRRHPKAFFSRGKTSKHHYLHSLWFLLAQFPSYVHASLLRSPIKSFMFQTGRRCF
jgi:hypothetical protein